MTFSRLDGNIVCKGYRGSYIEILRSWNAEEIGITREGLELLSAVEFCARGKNCERFIVCNRDS